MSGDALRDFIQKMEATAISTLEHVQSRKFKNETVEIDGKRFTSCEFDGCRLVYAGGDTEFGPGCVVENSWPEFAGPARRTLLLLHGLGLLNFDPNEEAKRRS